MRNERVFPVLLMAQLCSGSGLKPCRPSVLPSTAHRSPQTEDGLMETLAPSILLPRSSFVPPASGGAPSRIGPEQGNASPDRLPRLASSAIPGWGYTRAVLSTQVCTPRLMYVSKYICRYASARGWRSSDPPRPAPHNIASMASTQAPPQPGMRLAPYSYPGCQAGAFRRFEIKRPCLSVGERKPIGSLSRQ